MAVSTASRKFWRQQYIFSISTLQRPLSIPCSMLWPKPPLCANYGYSLTYMSSLYAPVLLHSDLPFEPSLWMEASSSEIPSPRATCTTISAISHQLSSSSTSTSSQSEYPPLLTTQFTAVRTLKIKTAFNSDSNPLDVLLRLFPRLDNTLDLGQLIGNIREEDYLAFRERSKEAQKRRAWSGLDSLVCDIATAYLLALQCPIRRMDLEVQYSSPHAGLHLADTLRHNCPRQLHVGLPLYGGFGVLDGMFPPEAADKLTHLVVFADSGRPYGCGARRKANAHWDRFTVSEQPYYVVDDTAYKA